MNALHILRDNGPPETHEHLDEPAMLDSIDDES